MTEQPTQLNSVLAQIPGLPPEIRGALGDLVGKTREALRDSLISVVLFGSAAEGKLRATSDINLLFVLGCFVREEVDPLRDSLRLAHAQAAVKVMFLLHDELPAASEAFAMKFSDIINRHVVLYGEDPLADIPISREAKIHRLKQALLNIAIRLRERYAMTSLREEQLVLALADMTGPLRVAAASLLELQGAPAASNKEALTKAAATLNVTGWEEALRNLSTARETRLLPSGMAAATCFTLMEIADGLRQQAERL